MIKVIAFDFDGVLVESGDLKTSAFAQIFRPYGSEIEKKVVAHHLEHGGISRYEKVRYYFEHFLQRSITTEEVNQICDRFAQMVVTGVIQAPYVLGAHEFLKTTKLPIFVVSGTPQTELEHIIQQRIMTPFFQDVYGTPQKKTYWLQHILAKGPWKPSELLFVGDSLSDYHSAVEAHVHFIGRLSDPAIHFDGLPQVDFIVSDLQHLPHYLNFMEKNYDPRIS